MALLLAVVVGLLYTQARASRARLLSLNQQAGEFSDYFKGIKPRYDVAYDICEKLSRMAGQDSDASWILKKHGVHISYDQKPAELR